MSRHKNNCLLEKQSILQTTLFHETEALGIKHVFSWQALAYAYQILSMGLISEVSIEDAKEYTKLLILLFITPLIGGLLEGGAL